MAHRCAGGLKKKLDLRSGSQRHRHFVGFFNVSVLAPTTKCLWRWEPDRRSNVFFSPPAHLCAVTYMTEISLIVTLNNQFTSPHYYHIRLLELFLFICVVCLLLWGEVNWLFNVTINDISVIYVTAHRCAGELKKKLDLRSGSQRHRHFVGFLNVSVQAPTRGQYGYSEKQPNLVAFYDTLGIRTTDSRLYPWVVKGGLLLRIRALEYVRKCHNVNGSTFTRL